MGAIFNLKTISRKGSEKVYEKFQKLLDERGITAYRVAKDTGILKSTFADWKKGLYTPKVDKLMAIAKYFSVPLEYFLEE